MFVCAHCTADCLPGDKATRHAQYGGCVLERAGVLQPVRLRDAAVLQRDQRVLHNAQCHLAFHLFGGEAGRVFLDQKALRLVVGVVARPDDGDVGEGGVADPVLLAVEHPAVTVTPCRGRETAGDGRADLRLRQPERTDLFHTVHWWQPLLLLLLRSAQVDRAHRQSTVHSHKRGDGGIDACQLHRDKAVQHRTSSCPPIPGVRQPGNTQIGYLRDELEWKLGSRPVLIDDRRDHFLAELTYLADNFGVFFAQERCNVVEIAGGGRQSSLARPIAPNIRPRFRRCSSHSCLAPVAGIVSSARTVPGWRAPSTVRVYPARPYWDFLSLISSMARTLARNASRAASCARCAASATCFSASRSLSAAVLATETLASSAAFWASSVAFSVASVPEAQALKTLRLMPLALPISLDAGSLFTFASAMGQTLLFVQ